MNNKVSSVLNSIEKIDNLIMEADVSVSDAMSDVYSKQFKMEGNVTEDYINHEYYQESVIAGILIGGGIIAVLATAIVLITKHVKKSASGDPEKKNDSSTAAGTALDNQEELKKKVEQIKGELTKAGGSVEITNNGINTTELNKKFELVTKLCDSAEGFLKEKEDDLIKQEIENFTKQLEEINKIQYKSSETVTVSEDSLTKIIDLAAPIKTMNDKLTKTAEELTKRSKENKNKSDSETDSDKKEKYNELKEGLERISKDSTQLSKDLTDDLNAIRSYMDAVLNAAKEKAKPAQAESETSQETPQNTDILKQKIYPITAKWASTSSNSDSKHPGAKLTADEAYNIIDSIHDNVVNHRALNVLDTLKAKANENPTNAILIKNLVESTIDDQNVFETDGKTINDIKSGLPELETIAANAPSEEPKKDESENSQEIKLSQEDTKNIAEFVNTFILQGKNKKGTATMSVDDIKNILSEIARSIKSSQYDDINDKIFELFNKQDNMDLKSIFVDLMLTAKDPIFNGKAPSESLLSDMKKIASGETIETEELKYKPNPKMDSVDASGKKSPDPTNGNPTLKDNNLMDSLSTITKDPTEILDAVIQNNPNYKKYENDQYAINKIIPELSKMRYDQLVQTVQAFTPPNDDPIKSSLLRDIAKEIAKEQGWTDKIDNIKLSDENEKRVNEYLRANKAQLTDDMMNDMVTAIYKKRRTEGKQIINDETDFIKDIINTMKNQGINPALSRNYNKLRAQIQSNPSLTDSAKHMAELMNDTAVYYGNLIGEKGVIMPIPADLTMASQTKSNGSEPEKKDETKPESEKPKEGTNESGEKITISKEGGALYDLITSWSDIEEFKHALNYGNAIISGMIDRSYNNELLLTNTGKVERTSTKFEITFGSEEEKRLISSFLNILDNFLNNEELFNKIPPELQKKLISAFDMFLKRNEPLFPGNINLENNNFGWLDIKNSINKLKEKYAGSKETKSDDTDTKSLPTVSELINDVDNVDKIVEAYNQTASSNDKIDSDKISWFKTYQNQIKTDNLKDIFDEFIKIHNVDLNGPISKSVLQTLLSASEDVLDCHGFESNLNDSFLSIKYEKYQNNPSRKQQIFDEAKKYAEMKNINVTLTKPDGEKVEVGTKSESRLSFVTTDTERAINAANQRNEQGVPLINDNEAKALRNANYDSWGFIEYYIFTKQHKKLNDLPFTRKLVKQLAQMVYRANKMEAMRNNLKGYLMNMYSKYADPKAKQRIYDEACTFVKYNPGLTAEVIDPDGNVKILNDPNEDWNV